MQGRVNLVPRAEYMLNFSLCSYEFKLQAKIDKI